jgi:hypothetical protein
MFKPDPIYPVYLPEVLPHESFLERPFFPS